MAENNPELDAINHLLQVEKDASSLIDDAMIEADKRLSDAHRTYNGQYKSKYDKLVSELEADYKIRHDKIEETYKKEIDEYKASLESKVQDEKAFDSLLDKLLLA